MKSTATTIAVRNRKLLRFTRSTTIEIISALFILLFVYTALSKFFEFANFKNVLGKSPLIGNYNTLVAWALPIVELIVSLLLFMPRTKLWGLYCSLALMTFFTLYIGYMLAFTPDLPCSCGGVIKEMSWTKHLVFNVFFTLLAGFGIWLSRKRVKLTEVESHPVKFT